MEVLLRVRPKSFDFPLRYRFVVESAEYFLVIEESKESFIVLKL